MSVCLQPQKQLDPQSVTVFEKQACRYIYFFFPGLRFSVFEKAYPSPLTKQQAPRRPVGYQDSEPVIPCIRPHAR